MHKIKKAVGRGNDKSVIFPGGVPGSLKSEGGLLSEPLEASAISLGVWGMNPPGKGYRGRKSSLARIKP